MKYLLIAKRLYVIKNTICYRLTCKVHYRHPNRLWDQYHHLERELDQNDHEQVWDQNTSNPCLPPFSCHYI